MSEVIINILNNKKCYIEIDLYGVKLLYNHLSFKPAGIEYSPAYKNGWHGITYLFNKTKNTFDLGLLDNVKTFLKKNNYAITINDNRPPIIINEPLDVSKRLSEIGMIPRDHQQRMIDLVPEHNKGIIRSCTGSGKSLAIALMTAKLNKPTIICVIGLDLLKQFHDLFSSIFDEKIGYIGNGVCDIQRINIASIWSIGSALNCKKVVDDDEVGKEKSLKDSQKQSIVECLKNNKVICFDESHAVTCDTFIKIYKASNSEYLFGFSGTPFREDGSDLLINAILGEQIIDISASELIEKGLLVQPIIKFLNVPPMHIPGNPTYQETYKLYIVENEKRNNMIVEQTKRLVDKGYTPLVLFKNIAHGNILYEKMLEAGIKCSLLSGKDKLNKRTEVKEDVMSGKINVIVASTIFDIGMDLPILNSLVLAGAGKSSIRALQRVGRVLRNYPGKKIAAIIEFNDDIKFLKGHSKKRYQTYKKEKGFQVIKSEKMK